MTTSTATSQQPQQAKTAPREAEQANLSFHYGTIGIQAVAAAARYSDVRDNPAEARTAPRIDLRFVESAV